MNSIAEPLSHFINKITEEGEFPKSFKIRVIVRLNENGVKEKLSNYRPEDCRHCEKIESKEGVIDVRRTTTELRKEWATAKSIDQQHQDMRPSLTWKTNNQRPTWRDISTMRGGTKALWTQFDSLIFRGKPITIAQYATN
ncbi:hypothetical protein WA026_022831 [Henosepilachna vigintioctopunctata]|uniref:Uncharacterized protein n=1 Tax=Henosepilachna vigintioctopunctata TaxID=420089 RepID=A0AAW1UXC9_9CUCU